MLFCNITETHTTIDLKDNILWDTPMFPTLLLTSVNKLHMGKLQFATTQYSFVPYQV